MSERSRLRLFVLRALVVGLLITLFGRLWYLQVLAGPAYRRAAANDNIRDVVTPAPRGLIVDDEGRVLAGNQAALVISVDRTQLSRQPDGGTAVLRRLAAVLHTSYPDLLRRIQPCGPRVPAPCWNGSPYQPVPVAERVDLRVALQILEQHDLYPGVTAQLQSVRDYPLEGSLSAAQVLGYLGPITAAELARLPGSAQAANLNDLVGRSGLEETYDRWLRGAPGLEQVSVDSVGAVTGVVSNAPPRPGDTLVTSLDAGVQQALENALASAVRSARATGPAAGGGPADTAAGVVIDARTGQIVAMASYPTYQPDAFVGGISTRAYAALTSPTSGYPLLNKAIQGQYPPGSTFKLVTTSAVVQEGTASLTGVYPCPPYVDISGTPLHNFESESYPPLSLHNALVVSCDTVFYGFAKTDYARDEQLIREHKQPREAVQHMAFTYGLGSATGVDLPDEASGLIPDRRNVYQQWKSFYEPNACQGMRNPHFSTGRRAFDAYICQYGGIFEPGDQAHVDIGQGSDLVTPLQLACAYTALVDGGIVYSPRVGEAVLSPSGQVVTRIRPQVRGRLDVPPDVLGYIEDAMYGVTRSNSPRGTATGAFAGFPFNRVMVGGKTGTADVSDGGAPDAWFASFAGPPGQPPEFVSVIMVSHGGQGGVTAAPATRQLWDSVFGLEGRPAAFPGGRPPAGLPRIAPNGTITPPATAATARPAAAARSAGVTDPAGPSAVAAAALPATPATRGWWPR